MTESEITAQLTKAMREAGIDVTPIVAGTQGARQGLPDRYITHLVWNGWFEAKIENGRLSPRQKHILNEWWKRHTPAIVLWYDATFSIQIGKCWYTTDLTLSDIRVDTRKAVELLECFRDAFNMWLLAVKEDPSKETIE